MDENLTIVGPEPSAPKNIRRRKRLNVEAILLMAKYDADFHKKLLADRSTALEETDLDLSQGEKLLFNSISDEQLSRNIREFRVPGVSRRSLSSWAKAAAVKVGTQMLVVVILVETEVEVVIKLLTNQSSRPSNQICVS